MHLWLKTLKKTLDAGVPSGRGCCFPLAGCRVSKQSGLPSKSHLFARFADMFPLQEAAFRRGKTCFLHRYAGMGGEYACFMRHLCKNVFASWPEAMYFWLGSALAFACLGFIIRLFLSHRYRFIAGFPEKQRFFSLE